jgi:N-acetylmuramoyl-L-alanine amidase
MKLFKSWLMVSLLLLSQALLAQNEIKGVRIWPSPESTRVVFDLKQAVKYNFSTLDSPNRVIIEFADTKLATDLGKQQLRKTGINKINSVPKAKNTLQVILELDQKFQPKLFTLPPNELYGHRLVLDLESNNKQDILALFDIDALEIAPKKQDFIIAIDPGHGGEDPGAIGPHGTKEKHIAFAISQHLKEIINKQPGMKAFLTRNGDYYLGFRERMRRARAKNADLFISIHADSYSVDADGASVFILSSDKKSSVAARWLARSENRADLVGGVSLNDKSDMLASVLLDLTQNANAIASIEAAKHVLRSLGKTTTLHKNKIESGGFLVLRSPDIPSILVETGFISNPSMELKLRNKNYQQKIATAIMLGAQAYLINRPRMVAQK